MKAFGRTFPDERGKSPRSKVLTAESLMMRIVALSDGDVARFFSRIATKGEVVCQVLETISSGHE